MKKSLLFLVLLFNNLYSQEGYNIGYKVYPTYGSIENDEEIKSRKTNIFLGVDNSLSDIHYTLNICEGNSFFSLNEGIYKNPKATGIALSFTGRQEIYNNKKDSLYFKIKKIQNEIFFIEYEPIKDWDISNEEKEISGFKCYKATKKISKVLRKNFKKDVVVIAWFCPEIPLSFGPMEYGNLPGLILELQDGRITFLADKIDKSFCKDFKIKYTINKSITEEEFINIVDEKAKLFLEGKRKKE